MRKSPELIFERIDIIPAQPGWFYTMAVYDSSKPGSYPELMDEVIIAWRITTKTWRDYVDNKKAGLWHDDRTSSTADPILGGDCISADGMANKYAIKRPDGIYSTMDRDCDTAAKLLEYFGTADVS